MSELLYTNNMTVHPEPNRKKRVELDGFDQTWTMGVHGPIAELYGTDPADSHPATIEHLTAAIAGCLTGALGGALGARGIDSLGNLETEVEGEVEKVGNSFVLANVKLRYRFTVPAGKREAAERAVSVHAGGCPVHQSLQRGITITWDAEIVEQPAAER